MGKLYGSENQRGSQGAGGDGMHCWRTCWGCSGDALRDALGMHWRCTGDANPAAQRRAGALPCSAGLPVTSNDFLCSCFRAGAAWPAGGLVAVSRAVAVCDRNGSAGCGPCFACSVREQQAQSSPADVAVVQQLLLQHI